MTNKVRNVKHAVIPVAGFGTRMLPLSKSIPKELLPLGNLPVIHYVIEEAIAAGIKHIVLVTHPQKQAIENYFDINVELDTALREGGKISLADNLQWLPEDVKISSIRQGKRLGLGHAVAAARPIIDGHDFAVLLPDVVIDPFKTNYAKQNLAYMTQQFSETGYSQILVDPVEKENIHKYGIARLDGKNQIYSKSKVNQSLSVSGFVEKPEAKDAPSNLAVVGRYVFDHQILDYLDRTAPDKKGEIQLTDAIDALIASARVDVTTMIGDSFDAGNMSTYLKAFAYFSEQQT